MTEGADGAPPSSLTRRQLYDLVWSIPMRKLARSFGWSDVWLAKLCRESGVPPPERGYWARKQAGRSARRRPFPRRLDPDEVIFTWDLSAPPDFEADAKKPIEPEFDADILATLRDLESVSAVELAAPEAKLHRLVVATSRASARECAPIVRRFQTWGYQSAEPERRLAPFGFDVGAALRDRGLRILDAVLRGFEAAGFVVAVPRGDGDGRARVTVLDQSFGLSIVEANKQRPFDPKRDSDGRSYYHPKIVVERSGQLTLRLSGLGHAPSRSWSDTPKRQLESVLPHVLAAAVRLVQAGRRAAIEAARRAEEERRREEARRMAEEQRRLEEDRRRRERERIDALLAESDRHARAIRVRELIQAAQQRASEDRAVDVASLGAWVEWAEAVASGLDPIGGIVERLRRTSTPPRSDPSVADEVEVDPLL